MVQHEEDSVIVIDAGSTCIKAGFSGEDTPRAALPAVIDTIELSNEERSARRARRPESTECYREYKTGGTAPSDRVFAVERGHVTSMDNFEKLLDSVFNYELAVYPDIHVPLLLTEPLLTDKKRRCEMAQLIFEAFRIPALSMCNTATLSLFASGRSTGLVLDCGGGVTHTVPVFEGFALNHAITRLELAGQDVTVAMSGHVLKGASALQLDTVRDMKERLGCVFGGGQECPDEEYELPDGSAVQLRGEWRCAAAEVLFDPISCGPPFAAKAADGGLAACAVGSIEMCDKDLKRDMYSTVVLAGGSTMMPGFAERLRSDMCKFAPEGSIPHVIPHPTCHEPGYNSQRRHAAWIGGSMFASLPTFKQIQVTKQEYEDVGESIMYRKCL